MGYLRQQIKEYAKTKKVPIWRIAQEYGLSDSNFSRMLRYDAKISKEKINDIYEIIDRLAAEQ